MWSISQIKLSSIEKIRIRSLRTQPLGFLRRKQTWNKSDRVRKGWRLKQQQKQQWLQEHLLARAKAFNLATVFIVSTACQAAATQGTHQYQSSHKGFELLKMRSKTSRSLTTAWHESWKQVRRFGELYFRALYFGERYFLLQKEADIVYEEAAHSTLRFEEFVLGVLSIFLLYNKGDCTMYNVHYGSTALRRPTLITQDQDRGVMDRLQWHLSWESYENHLELRLSDLSIQ